MKNEQSRPRGLLPYGTESEAITAAEEIVREHARNSDKRAFDTHVTINKALDTIYQVGAIIVLAGAFLIQSRGVSESISFSQPIAPSSHVLEGETLSIREMELYCASHATATTKSDAYASCMDEKKGFESIYTSPNYYNRKFIPRAQPLPTPPRP